MRFTSDLEMPSNPIAWTRSSTRRVDTLHVRLADHRHQRLLRPPPRGQQELEGCRTPGTQLPQPLTGTSVDPRTSCASCRAPVFRLRTSPGSLHPYGSSRLYRP